MRAQSCDEGLWWDRNCPETHWTHSRSLGYTSTVPPLTGKYAKQPTSVCLCACTYGSHSIKQLLTFSNSIHAFNAGNMRPVWRTVIPKCYILFPLIPLEQWQLSSFTPSKSTILNQQDWHNYTLPLYSSCLSVAPTLAGGSALDCITLIEGKDSSPTY